MTTATGRVRTEVDGSIGYLFIDNEPRRNAMNLAMYAAVPAAVATLTAHDALRVVVLRGAGDAAFGAGSDISEFATKRMGPEAAVYNQIEAAAARSIESIAVPVVALIHGSCMGGGIGLALCADIRYAADDAKFAVTPGKLGVGYPPDSMARLVATVGLTAAKELVLTARTIDASEAQTIGFISTVVAKADLDDFVTARCAQIAALAPLTLQAAKLAATDPGGEATAAAVARCYSSADYGEGIAAYQSRRPPTFLGR